MKASLGGDWIDVVVHSDDAVPAAAELLRRISDTEPEIDAETRRVSAPVADRMGALGAVVRELGERAEDIALRRPTLDEVFLALTEAPATGSQETAARRDRHPGGRRRASHPGHPGGRRRASHPGNPAGRRRASHRGTPAAAAAPRTPTTETTA